MLPEQMVIAIPVSGEEYRQIVQAADEVDHPLGDYAKEQIMIGVKEQLRGDDAGDDDEELIAYPHFHIIEANDTVVRFDPASGTAWVMVDAGGNKYTWVTVREPAEAEG